MTLTIEKLLHNMAATAAFNAWQFGIDDTHYQEAISTIHACFHDEADYDEFIEDYLKPALREYKVIK